MYVITPLLVLVGAANVKDASAIYLVMLSKLLITGFSKAASVTINGVVILAALKSVLLALTIVSIEIPGLNIVAVEEDNVATFVLPDK